MGQYYKRSGKFNLLLKTQYNTYNSHMFISGKNHIEEYIGAGGKILLIYVKEGYKIPENIAEYIKKHSIKVERVTPKELKRISGDERARNIVAKVPEFEYSDAYKIIQRAIEEKGIALYLDHIEDPVNLGAIIRSAFAFKTAGIILPKNRACRVTPTVIRVSEGYAFKMPIAIITNPMNFIKEARKMGLFILSLERGGEPLSKVSIPKPALLVAGSEGRGVSRKIMENSDMILSIEQSEEINSLNVHVAVSIALYKAFTENQA